VLYLKLFLNYAISFFSFSSVAEYDHVGREIRRLVGGGISAIIKEHGVEKDFRKTEEYKTLCDSTTLRK
jgi:hypothetical protein